MIRKKNVLLAIDRSTSAWPSIHRVDSLMIRCLKDAFPDAPNFLFSARSFTKKERSDWSFVLKEQHPDIIVFVVKDFPPLEQLSILSRYDPDRRTRIVFYLCGSLPEWIHLWHPLEEVLRGFHTVFVCPSESDAQVSRSFLKSATVTVIPYPVSARDFYKGRKWKRKRRVQVVYAGRIAPQKGLDHALMALYAFFQKENLDWRIDIYGSFQDSILPPVASYHHDWKTFRKLLLAIIRERRLVDRVRFHGQVRQARLRRVYEEADLFVSLSVFHPEEFGFSVSEAIRCGCPCLISEWSGYRSFSRFLTGVYLVPTCWKNGLVSFEPKSILQALESWRRAMLGDRHRIRLSRAALRWNSEEAVTRMLQRLVRLRGKPFRGLSKRAMKLVNLIDRKQSLHIYDFPLSRSQQKSYMEFYGPYFQGGSKTAGIGRSH